MFAGLLLGAALAAATLAGHRPAAGPVYLLSREICAARPLSGVRAAGASVLLVAAAPTTPAPLDARDWAGDEQTWILDVHSLEGGQLDAARLGRLRDVRRICLGPGSARQWAEAFGCGAKATDLAQAVLAAWRAGTAVVACGDAAVVLGAGYIGEPSEDASLRERNPRASAESRHCAGLGLFAFDLIDSAERSRGRLEHLVDAIVAGESDLALYLPAGGGLRWEPHTGDLIGLGDAAVLIFDGRRARRTGRDVTGLELAFLAGLHAWNPRPTPEQRAARVSAPAAEVRTVDDLWSASNWSAAAHAGAQPFSLASGIGRIDFRPLAASREQPEAPLEALRGLLDSVRP